MCPFALECASVSDIAFSEIRGQARNCRTLSNEFRGTLLEIGNCAVAELVSPALTLLELLAGLIHELIVAGQRIPQRLEALA
jgi:hypothetical protein